MGGVSQSKTEIGTKMRIIRVLLLISVMALANCANECPGAKEEQYVGGSEYCGKPNWNYWYYSNNIYLPARDPTSFYQFTSNSVVQMRCAPGTCFSQVKQYCVHSYEWQNPCAPPPPPESDVEIHY